MRLIDKGAALSLLLAVSAACPSTPMTGPMDLRGGGGDDSDQRVADPAADLSGADQRGGTADLTKPPDLSMVDLVPPPDLFIPDLAPPTLDPLPACAADATVTASDVFTIANTNNFCSCHVNGNNSGGMGLGNNAPTLRGFLLGIDSNAANMKRVTAFEPNKSFLLYKLLNQQGKVSMFGGGGMPQGAGMFPDANANFCKWYNWVKNGAPL